MRAIGHVLFVCVLLSSHLPAVAGQDRHFRLDRPHGVAFDAHDRLLIADTGNHRVLVLSPALELLQIIGAGPGMGDGEFNEPMDVACDSQGRVVVVEQRNHRVQVFDPKGRHVMTVGKQGKADGEFQRPSKVTIDDCDNWIVTDTWNHRLQVFSPDGRALSTLENRTGKKPAEQLKAGRESAKTRKRDPAQLKEEWQPTDEGQFREPGGVFFHRRLKRLYVANGWNCRVEVLDYDSRTGEMKRRGPVEGIIWGFWITRGLVLDPRGRLVGCDTGFGQLKVFANVAHLETNRPRPDLIVKGGTLGAMHQVTDIAVNSKGEFAVADTGNDRVIVFGADFQRPEDPRVLEVSRNTATLSWQTLVPTETKIEYRRGDHPQKTPGHLDDWAVDPTWEKSTPGERTQHELTLTDLQPGKRYYYRLHDPSVRIIPPNPWTHEYAFATKAAEGEKAFVRIPVKLLLACNLIDATTVDAGAPLPEPMTKEEIELYWDNFRLASRFYWNLSSMQYWVDFDVFVDETMYRKGKPAEGAGARFEQLPEYSRDRSLRSVLQREGKLDTTYYGQIVCEAVRRWNKQTKEWSYQGSGGGTYGIKWPQPGRSHFLGGSDIAWLTCHEYHHQMEPQYTNSGLTREDDRVIFCHFASKHKGWKWCTAYDHGRHWDGIGYQLRTFMPTQYMRNLYGEVLTAKDMDGDGIPDDDPRLPFDEKRFNSDPARRDTDGDGLDDMQEILTSNWQPYDNAPLRTKIAGSHVRPDARNPDSDGDGIRDNEDPYPLYPFEPLIAKGDVTVDGRLAEWGDQAHCWMEAHGLKARCFTRHDGEQLVFAVELAGGWRHCTLTVDLDADGHYVGRDNLLIRVTPAAAGPQLQSARLHVCDGDRWPYFYKEPKEREDTDGPVLFRQSWLPFGSGKDEVKQRFEVGIPRNEPLGLFLESGEQVGVKLRFGIPDKGEVSMFEPQRYFDCRVE